MGRSGWRAALTLVAALVVLLATGASSAARVSPDDVAAGLSPPVWPGAGGSSVGAGASTAASTVGPARGRGWPLAPQPAVLALFDPPAVSWGAGHRGVDLAASVGQEVLAPVAGVVVFSGVVVDRGVVVVATSAGWRTTFEPVESAVSAGTPVARGQPIGRVAATPGHCAPATCLHWGVLRGDVYLDPLALIGAGRVVLLPLRPP